MPPGPLPFFLPFFSLLKDYDNLLPDPRETQDRVANALTQFLGTTNVVFQVSSNSNNVDDPLTGTDLC